MSTKDIEKFISQAAKGGKQATESAKVGSRTLTKPQAAEPAEEPATQKLAHRVRVYGAVDERIHGGKRPTQRVIDYVQHWLDDNVDTPHSVALNWLLIKGIEYAETQLESGDLIITDGDLPPKP